MMKNCVKVGRGRNLVKFVVVTPAVNPTTYGAPILRRFGAGAKVTQIIYPAPTLRHFRASQIGVVLVYAALLFLLGKSYKVLAYFAIS